LTEDLVAERGSKLGNRTLLEESPVGSTCLKVLATSCIVAFLAEYASYLLNRLAIGKDGKTAFERKKGKSDIVCWHKVWREAYVKEQTEGQDYEY
jgi:hypothetical protein